MSQRGPWRLVQMIANSGTTYRLYVGSLARSDPKLIVQPVAEVKSAQSPI